MAERPHGFTRDGARRIVDVVRGEEAAGATKGVPRGRRPPMYMPGMLVPAITGTSHEEVADQQWSFEWKEAWWGSGLNQFVERPGGRSSFDSQTQMEDPDLRAWLLIGAIPIDDYEMPPSGANACSSSLSINEQTYNLASSLLIRKPLKSGTPVLLQLIPRAGANKSRWTIVNLLPRLCPYCPAEEAPP